VIYFEDNMEGWGKARLFLEFMGGFYLDSDTDSRLKKANGYALRYHNKYLAWKSLMRMTHGDEFKDYPMKELYFETKTRS